MECWQTLENPVTDIWKFEYSKKGTPDTCMETTLWDLELILSWKWAKWVSTATCRAGKKVWKYKVRCDLVSFPDRTFKLLSDISCFFFCSISIGKNCRISRKRNFVKNLFCIGLKKCLKTDQNRSKNSSKKWTKLSSQWIIIDAPPPNLIIDTDLL